MKALSQIFDRGEQAQQHEGETVAERQARAEAAVRERLSKRVLEHRDAQLAASDSEWTDDLAFGSGGQLQ